MADHFGCSIKVFYRRLKDFGISISSRFAVLEDEELDRKVKLLKDSFPLAGTQMIQGYLESEGKHLQRQRVRNSVRRVDPDGSASRWSTAVHRRVYKVPTPNAIWHMDGHMKLIRWGLSTHGCVDGYSRFITFMVCNTNNSASTVSKPFVRACSLYGLPSHVRSDHGMENPKVTLFMNLVRRRSSHITCRSVHNQRIERMWRDLHKEVTSTYYQKFYSLEDNTAIQLNPDNPVHIKALHYLYLPEINSRIEQFRNGWNLHRMRTSNHKSPQQLWISGMLNSHGSNFTAASEAFGNVASLQDRLLDSLSQFGLTATDLELPEPSQEQLSEEQKNTLDTALATCNTEEEKFLVCVETFFQ